MCTGGELAQMVERPLRMREVPGSIPGFSRISFYYNKVKVLLVDSRNFRKFKVALNPMYRIFLNFAKSCVLSCLLQVDNIKKIHLAVFEL